MQEREWTTPQQYSIDARGGSLLVSAAAGSGKTAVLVERVIRRITDPRDAVDVDRLLIVTFTRAAAAEMKQRLTKALAERIAADPDNALYQRQQMLLPGAAIETVDGFCARLLREQAARAGLPPRFRVAEESEADLLRGEALDEILEEAYTQQDPAFLALTEQLVGKRDDIPLRDAVTRAAEFMQAQPFPQKWLQEQMDAYTAVTPPEATAWFRAIAREAAFDFEQLLDESRKLYRLAVDNGIEQYQEALYDDTVLLQGLRDGLTKLPYEQFCTLLENAKFLSLRPFSSKDAALTELKNRIQDKRSAIKTDLGKWQKNLLFPETAYREDLAALAPVMEALGRLIGRYTQVYTEKKRQKKWLDYADLEHECLRLLLDETTGQRTPLAEELGARYDEIMVDEYQDTNAAQDALFRALSRREKNLFLVGDVKQSIYGFRQAMPEIFNRRRREYNEYSPVQPLFPATVTLEHNFRSRCTVTDTVNFLFRQLMHEPLGGVEYDEREALRYAAPYGNTENPPTEWILIDHPKEEKTVDRITAEARQIAARIREQMRSLTVQTRQGARALEYGDICILLRSMKQASLYERELVRQGIPVSSESSGGLLQTPEIMTVASLMRIIDNPLREVEMVAVMLSPLYGFTPDDCAVLRQDPTVRTLYAALEKQAAGDTLLSRRCRALWQDLKRFRLLAVSLSVDRLLERIDREIGITALFSARSGGRQRVANLHQFDQIARGFEQGEFRGLSAFVRYLDRLEEQGKDLPGGNDLHADGVRIMTVHASKGLEFPVVYLAQLDKKFNDNDSREEILFHHTAGIGMRRRDPDTLEKSKTLPFVGVSIARRLDDRAEELRLWYVALTRAREQLCVVLSYRELKDRLASWEDQLPAGTALPPGLILRALCPADWFMMAALRHPSFAFLRSDPTAVPSLSAEQEWAVTYTTSSAEEQPTDPSAAPETESKPDEALIGQLHRHTEFVYPYVAVSSAPAKLAASQLSHEAMRRKNIAEKRPAFLQKEGMDAAEKGTALHTFMQFADFRQGAADPAAEADRLLRDGFITPRQRDVLPLDRIRRFFDGALFARMQASPDCRREFPFTVPIPAVSADGIPLPPGENTVVQGIADCVFREGDGLILVDYKTDRVKTPDELRERYRSQMEFYRKALEIIFGLPVRETVLYSFSLGTGVLLE